MIELPGAPTARTLTLVYTGPPGSGKRSTLRELHRQLAPAYPADLVTLDPEDPGLRVDLLTIFVRGRSTWPTLVRVYALSPVPRFEAVHHVLLGRADGVVFVADARTAQQRRNVEVFRALQKCCQRIGKGPSPFPLVLQFNRMDLLDSIREEEARQAWGSGGVPMTFTSSDAGWGVLETFELLARLVYRSGAAGLKEGMGEEDFIRRMGCRSRRGLGRAL